jgi:hypothetical protein
MTAGALDDHGVTPGVVYRHYKGHLYRVLMLARYYGADHLAPDAEVVVHYDPDIEPDIFSGIHLLACVKEEVDHGRVLEILEAKNSTDGPTPDGCVLVVYVCLYDDGRLSVREASEFASQAPTGVRRFERVPDGVAAAASSDRLASLLERWLAWQGRSEDEVDPLERETARALGHADDCELAEYGVCTCKKNAELEGVAANRAPLQGRALPTMTPFQQVRAERRVVDRRLDPVPATPKCCKACRYSGIEPSDMNLTCGHPDAGVFGLHIWKEPLEHCPDFIKFEQHPGRNPDGTLKSA